MLPHLLLLEEERATEEWVAQSIDALWPGCDVTIAHSREEALRCVTKDQFDLVILDLCLSTPMGLEICRRIRERAAGLILLICALNTGGARAAAFDLGADQYLVKPFDQQEFLARLRALARRAQNDESSSANGLVGSERVSTDAGTSAFALDPATHAVTFDGRHVALTKTEFQLLQELAQHPGEVLTHRALLEHVWGPQYIFEVHYLKVFVQRLRRKLGDDALHPRLIRTEWGVGYCFEYP